MSVTAKLWCKRPGLGMAWVIPALVASAGYAVAGVLALAGSVCRRDGPGGLLATPAR